MQSFLNLDITTKVFYNLRKLYEEHRMSIVHYKIEQENAEELLSVFKTPLKIEKGFNIKFKKDVYDNWEAWEDQSQLLEPQLDFSTIIKNGHEYKCSYFFFSIDYYEDEMPKVLNTRFE